MIKRAKSRQIKQKAKTTGKWKKKKLRFVQPMTPDFPQLSSWLIQANCSGLIASSQLQRTIRILRRLCLLKACQLDWLVTGSKKNPKF